MLPHIGEPSPISQLVHFCMPVFCNASDSNKVFFLASLQVEDDYIGNLKKPLYDKSVFIIHIC